MHKAPSHSLTLLPRQTRLINATEGLQLEVQSGCLWLTRPGDAVDRFLVAGDSIALHENLVLIQSDRHPGARGQQAAGYRLTPLRSTVQAQGAIAALQRVLASSLSTKVCSWAKPNSGNGLPFTKYSGV